MGGVLYSAVRAGKYNSGHAAALGPFCHSACGQSTSATSLQALPSELANMLLDALLRAGRLQEPQQLELFAHSASALRLSSSEWPSYQRRVSLAWFAAASKLRCVWASLQSFTLSAICLSRLCIISTELISVRLVCFSICKSTKTSKLKVRHRQLCWHYNRVGTTKYGLSLLSASSNKCAYQHAYQQTASITDT